MSPIKRVPLFFFFWDQEVSVQIELFKNGQWQPFQAQDIQLEFQMLDPYVRTMLTPSPSGKFMTVIKAPDSYGVFQFKINYKRMGLTYLSSAEVVRGRRDLLQFLVLFIFWNTYIYIYTYLVGRGQVTIRPFRHNEYERFIVTAFPYYTSAFSMMMAFLVFGVFFLYQK